MTDDTVLAQWRARLRFAETIEAVLEELGDDATFEDIDTLYEDSWALVGHDDEEPCELDGHLAFA